MNKLIPHKQYKDLYINKDLYIVDKDNILQKSVIEINNKEYFTCTKKGCNNSIFFMKDTMLGEEIFECTCGKLYRR